MKRYIKSETYDDIQKRTLTLDIEVFVCVDNIEDEIIMSSDTYDLPIAYRQIAEDISNDFDEIVSAMLGILHSFGYGYLDYHKSDRSNSLYFTFCRETEFDLEEVNLIIGLMVSDHDPPRWRNDKSGYDARTRLEEKLQKFAEDNSFLNKYLNDDGEIETTMLFIKYENTYYNVYEDVFEKVRQKLRSFKKYRRKGIT